MYVWHAVNPPINILPCALPFSFLICCHVTWCKKLTSSFRSFYHSLYIPPMRISVLLGLSSGKKTPTKTKTKYTQATDLVSRLRFMTLDKWSWAECWPILHLSFLSWKYGEADSPWKGTFQFQDSVIEAHVYTYVINLCNNLVGKESKIIPML